MKNLLLVVFTFLVVTFNALATEGMWIPTMLAAIESDMQAFGLELSAEDIYSVNQSSLKDAIVQFGGGCTGEIISSRGLLLTNHHCGYRQIQSHSSLEHNYLKDGFWAANLTEELPNAGLTAMFVVSITDVTGEMLKGIAEGDDMAIRRGKIAGNEAAILARIREELPGLGAFIRPFNYGNSYFLMVTRTFNDVRLVGAPPSSIGKFGGDTDNWVWPRHTGDFSLFRVYADENNRPADYAESNRPYEPQRHLAVSLDGVNEGDFTMVFGFPGRTDRYLTTAAVEYVINESNPMRITMRETSLGIIDAAMRSDEALHIKYTAKQSMISNYYKKWIGQNAGLIELDAISEKRKIEGAFRSRSLLRNNRPYMNAIDQLDRLNNDIRDYQMARDVFIEYYHYGPEILRFANAFAPLINDYEELESSGELERKVGQLQSHVQGYFKNYDRLTDELIFERLTELYFRFTPETQVPEIMKAFRLKFKDNPALMRTALYGRTVFTDQALLMKLLDAPSAKGFKKLQKDPAFELAAALWEAYRNNFGPAYERMQAEINEHMRLYVAGIQEFFPDTNHSFDANSTLRLTYGKVEGSAPYDGMQYTYNTTHRGILQKAATGKDDYEIDELMKGLLEVGLFGPYANEDGSLPVCFTGSNHTTGGNSGSPAINGRGELVGLNFDRSWESTMSDLLYDGDRCRNIMVDARYILWVVDIYAGAGHLVEEMTLVSKNEGKIGEAPFRK